MLDLKNALETITNKEDFIEFVNLLITDLAKNPDEWENKTLDSYLEAIGRWTEDMEGYYLNHHLSIPENVDWKVVATILIAAKIYE